MSAEPSAATPRAGLGQAAWLAAGVAFLLGMLFRGVLLALWPEPFAFDGYQRWMGRDHVLVQDWLPLTQSVIWAVTRLGADLMGTRIAMSLLGATAAVTGAWAAIGLAGGRREAAWWWVPLSVFGGFTAWSSVLYQEGTFIAVYYLGLALALNGRLRLADLAFGLLGLVRYEGWPFVFLYIVWRRDPRALVAMWGILLWSAIRVAGIEGFRASPVDFADWNGIVERFDWGRQLHQTKNLIVWSSQHGCMVIFGAALVEAWFSRRARLLFVLFVVQLGITEAWLAGLETGTSRMLIVPTMVLAPAAAALGVRLQGRWRTLGIIGVVGFAFSQIPAAVERCSKEVRRIRPELQLITMMDACEDCVWWVDPRPRLGTRARHDGCEIIAGASEHVVGEDLYCAGWQDAATARAAFAACTHTARWDGESYRTVQHGRDSSRYGPPPSLAPAASTVDPNPE